MTDEFIFDPKKHVYTLNGKPLHGITTVLGVIGKPALIQWAANEAIKFLKANLNELHRQVEDYDDWQWNEELFEQARTAHARKRDDAAEKGTDLHALVEEYVDACLEGNGYADDRIEHAPEIQPFVTWAIENNIKFLASEQRLYSKTHWTAGTCDLVFEKDGKTYIGDIKTYKKIWDRVPFFQCAAYGMMWEEMRAEQGVKDGVVEVGPPPHPLMGHTMYTFPAGWPRIEGYCVLRLSKDGTFEALWSFDVEGDRQGFLAALTLHKRLAEFGEIKTNI